MSDHAILAPSAASRWLHCPGSIDLVNKLDLPPEEDSPFAAEGTEAHEWAHKILSGSCTIEDIPVDFRHGLRTYVDHVEDVLERFGKNTEIHFEVKLRPMYSAVELWGTADTVIFNANQLAVIDLKYGRGVIVEPEDNAQLLTYAALAREHFDIDPNNIELHISQPRAWHQDGPNRQWSIGHASLDKWWDNTTAIASLIEAGKAEYFLVAGEDQCRWCDAVGHCATQARDLPMKAFGGDPEILEVNTAGAMLARRKEFDSFFNAVEKRLYKIVLGGEHVPGWKLVQKKSQRKWSDPDAVIALLKKKKIPQRLFMDFKLKSFTALLKDVKLKPFVEKYVIKPDAGVSLARHSDPRAAATPADAFKDEANPA